MYLADQPNAERKGLELIQPPLERGYVVEDLFDIGVRRFAHRLGVEDVRQRRLGPLDPRRGERFAQQIRADEEIRVGQQLAHPGEPAK